MAKFDDILKKAEAWYERLAERIVKSALYKKWEAATADKRLKQRIQIQHMILWIAARPALLPSLPL
jgi:hypothetical protein